MDYYHISREDLGKNAKIPLKKMGDIGEVFYEMALDMFEEIKRNNENNRRSVIICPVGPTGQYPIFVRLVNEHRLSLENTWFINMDEYLNDDDTWIAKDDPLSFRGFMQRTVYDCISPALIMPPEQRIFPDPQNVAAIPALIEQLGGVDLALGGIGLNGHLAFNEPQDELTPDEFAALHTRVLTISRETRASNAISSLNGAVDAMPKKCITIGMAELLSAKRIRVAVHRPHHRAVVRQAAYGEVTAHFPATLLQRHPDAMIYVNSIAAEQPF